MAPYRDSIPERPLQPWILVLWLAVLASLEGAAQQPTPTDGPPVGVGEPVQLTDLSLGGPTIWRWDFDFDGIEPPTFDSFDPNPVVTFLEARPHQVLLEVCSDAGCDRVIKEVTVVEPPVEIFRDDFESGHLAAWSEMVP